MNGTGDGLVDRPGDGRPQQTEATNPSEARGAPGSAPSPASKITHSSPGLGVSLGGASPGGAPLGGAPPGPLSSPASPFPAPPEEAATAAAQASARPGTPPATPATASPTSPTAKQIRTFGDRKRHEDSWTRTPNTNGTGAIHVKTFHSKLTDEAMTYLDQQVNEWLDAHPQYEVKFVSTAIGEFTGKLKEPHLIVQMWV